MRKKIGLRILACVVLGVSFFVLPAWCSFLFAVAGVFLFRYYFEALFFGVATDLLFGTAGEHFWTSFPYTIFFLVLLCILDFLVKPRLRIFENHDVSS